MDYNKLKKLIAMLGSDQNGECLAAISAIRRLLAAEGRTFTDLADWLVVPRNMPRQTAKPRRRAPREDPIDAMLHAAMRDEMIAIAKEISKEDDQVIADVLGANYVRRYNIIVEKLNKKIKISIEDHQFFKHIASLMTEAV